jgi:GNAT superfamily N-acetyltransferase
MTGPARIRPARREDVPALWALLLALARYERLEHAVTGDAATLERHLFGEPPLVRARVAERDGGLVGYTLTYTTYSSFRTAPILWLEDLFVLPEERGSGTGRALFAACAAEARSLGCVRLAWDVLDWNEPALGFYRARGARADDGGWTRHQLDGAALAALAAEAGTGD